MAPLKIIDLFSGAGGLSDGFLQTGMFEALGAVEINEAAAETYIKNHGGDPSILIKPKGSDVSDITKIDFRQYVREKNVSSSELVVIGGPPCQGFSNANRQRNSIISGNNLLVKEFVRAIDEIRPLAFLMENVKTIDSDKHKFFVTERNEKKDYGSEYHLSEITKNDGDFSIDKLIKDDSIVLINSGYDLLRDPINVIVQEQDNIPPIIQDENLISRLRIIERKHIKRTRLNAKDKNGIKELIEHLKSVCINPRYIDCHLEPVIRNAVNGLKELENGQTEQKFIEHCLGPLIDINNLLLRIHELKSEKIETSIIKNAKNPLKVEAKVRSYNVVDYLRCVFKHLGYNIEYGHVTASDYGVPQRRTRFVMIGVKGDGIKKPNLPQKIDRQFTTRDAIYDLVNIEPQSDMNKYQPVAYQVESGNKNNNALLAYFRTGANELHNHVNTASRELSRRRFEEIKKRNGKNFHSLSTEMKRSYSDSSRTQNTVYLRLDYNEPAPTVVNIRKSMWSHPENAVALSIREAARLQSFKDNFIFYGTKDEQYQQIGNAVPPLLGRALAESILETIGLEPKQFLRDILK